MEAEYKQIKKLGNGAFGTAYLCQNNKTGENVVMKVVNISKMDINMQRLSQKEVNVLKTFNHPNVIKYIDSKLDKQSISIVMEYADSGDLELMLRKQRDKEPLTEEEVIHYFLQIALGLKHIHLKHILHRDLKTQNIFMTKDKLNPQQLVVKIGDFGISRKLQENVNLAFTFAGTPQYMAPEMLQRRGYNNKSDIWSLGCILYELCTCNKLFKQNSMQDIMQHVLGTKVPQIDASRYSKNVQSLLNEMLQKDPTKRPSINGILRHDYLQKRIGEYLSTEIIRRDFPQVEAAKILMYVKENLTMCCSAGDMQAMQIKQLAQQITEQNQLLEKENKRKQAQQEIVVENPPLQQQNNRQIVQPQQNQNNTLQQPMQHVINQQNAQLQAFNIVPPRQIKPQCNHAHPQYPQSINAIYQQKIQERERALQQNREQQKKLREQQKKTMEQLQQVQQKKKQEEKQQYREYDNQFNQIYNQMFQNVYEPVTIIPPPVIQNQHLVQDIVYNLPDKQQLQNIKRNTGFVILDQKDVENFQTIQNQQVVEQQPQEQAIQTQIQPDLRRSSSEQFSDLEPLDQNVDNAIISSKQAILNKIGEQNYEQLLKQIKNQIIFGNQQIDACLYKNDQQILMEVMRIMMFEK